MASFTTVPEALAAYEHWLVCQPLSNHTRRTYLTQVRGYCTYLSALHWEYGHPLQELHQGFSQKVKRAHIDWNTTVGVS